MDPQRSRVFCPMNYRFFFLLLHAVAAVLSVRLAFVFRFYFDPLPFVYDEMLLRTLPLAMVVKAVAADLFGLTRQVWRFASIRDVRPVVLAAFTGSLVFVPLTRWLEGGRYPNGPLLLDFLLTLSLFTAIRFSGRFWVESGRLLRGIKESSAMRVLIVGAGDRGEMALRFLSPRNRVVGFLDNRAALQKRLMMGVPVLGPVDQMPGVLKKHRVDEVVIALEEPGPECIRELFIMGLAAGCQVSLMPELSSAAPVHGNPIRELKMSDFLGREPVKLDPAPLEAALGGTTVLVTGAGGSIGSELCRQIARLPVKRLCLLDYSETALFTILEELKGKESSPLLKPLLCDIRDLDHLREVFSREAPDVVYHAAAFKHVPMMEAHPLEAARTNVLGTRNVVEMAREVGVKRFLHVSTDKAVQPESVMGASKAWGEWIVRAAGYSCVRFGNVLGSSGSVIPLFEKQWDREGELRVTHGEATRYFMTVEEAVLLMLHAEILRGKGEVYILDMGEPVLILDLARQLLVLKGNGVEAEENIRIVGLRPGERLHERLHHPGEALEPTPVTKVRKVSGAPVPPIGDALDQLSRFLHSRDEEGVRTLLLRICQ